MKQVESMLFLISGKYFLEIVAHSHWKIRCLEGKSLAVSGHVDGKVRGITSNHTFKINLVKRKEKCDQKEVTHFLNQHRTTSGWSWMSPEQIKCVGCGEPEPGTPCLGMKMEQEQWESRRGCWYFWPKKNWGLSKERSKPARGSQQVSQVGQEWNTEVRAVRDRVLSVWESVFFPVRIPTCF